MKNNKVFPTLVIKDRIDINLLENYNKLFLNTKNWIPCEKDIASISPFLLNNWFERLYLERLEKKAIFIKELLLKSGNNYEAVLFQLLAKNFGLKVNGDAFLSLAQSVDFSIVRKESFDEDKLAALLFGQAGFLNDDIEDEYHKELKKEYRYQQNKYKLKPIAKSQFQFFRMRPNNFPTIRIAQLVTLYFKHQNLFSKLIESKKVLEIYNLLNIQVSEFWQTHYTFEKSAKKSGKKITKSFMNLVLINTIVPLKFVYENERKQINIDDFLQLIIQLPTEKNSIISKFSECKINAKNAFESQALLELKNEYCNHKKCLKCYIGNSLLNTVT